MSRNLLPVTTALFVLFAGPLVSNNLWARADDPKQSPPDKPAPVLQDDDAIKELRRLGATLIAVKPPDGTSDTVSVRIAGDWHGTSDDFKLLSRVTKLERLTALGVPITDDDLKQLDGLSRLTLVELFGTKVTADGAARLAKTQLCIKVDRRTNAMLGVAGETDPAGVRITVVQAWSAADRGGLMPDDIIVKFAGHDVGDFKALTSLVGA